MGQAKCNPNVQLAKEGKLPPKPKKMYKREQERKFEEMVAAYMASHLVFPAEVLSKMPKV